MNDNNFPLKKVDRTIMEQRLAQLTEVFTLLVNKEISSIQSDVKRIVDVVQAGGLDKTNR